MAEDNTNITTETEELSQDSNEISEMQDEMSESKDEVMDDGTEDISVEPPVEEEQIQIFDEENDPASEKTDTQTMVYSGDTEISTQSTTKETSMKVSQIFEGISKDQIPEDFALDWKVTEGSYTNYNGTLKKKDATVTESDGKVTLTWTVMVPKGPALNILFTGENYEVNGYNVTTNYKNYHYVTTNYGASPQRVTNTYTRKDSIEYYSEDGSQLLYTDTKATNADTCNFSVYKGAANKEGYEFVGWSKHPYASPEDTNYNLKKGPSLTKDQAAMKLYAVYAKTIKDEEVTINVHLEYIDSSLEDGYQVSKAYVPVTVNCLTTYAHKETGATHQVKYHDIIEALGDFEDFAVRKGYEIVGMTPNEGAEETVFDLDNTFMQSGRENGGDFYLVAKKVYTLSYDGNAADASEIPEAVKTVSASGNVSFTVSNKVPVRDGYTFGGWATAKDSEIAYQQGETVTTDGNKQNVTLYGVWKKNPEPETEPKKDQETEKKPETEQKKEQETEKQPETTVKTSMNLNLKASGANKAISLKWTKVPEASGYEVYAAQYSKGAK